jgi:hypothetical protein
MAHKWSDREKSIVRLNRDMTAAEIKEKFFRTANDITVKGIQRQKDQLRGESMLRNNKPVEQWELELIKNVLTGNVAMTNAELSVALQRKPDIIDRLKHRVKKEIGLPKKPTPKIPKARTRKSKPALTVIPPSILSAEADRVYKLVDELKSIDPSVIKFIRSTRKIKDNNPEPVSIYDYLKVPTTDDFDAEKKARLAIVFRFIKKRVEHYNRLTLGKAGKSHNISTHQFNLVRLIFGLRVTSWRNLNIQDNMTELKNMTAAMNDYCTDVRFGTKVLPNELPIHRKRKS